MKKRVLSLMMCAVAVACAYVKGHDMKKSIVLALAIVALFQSYAGGAVWISYPGDFGVYLGEKVQARRPEWNGCPERRNIRQ